MLVLLSLRCSSLERSAPVRPLPASGGRNSIRPLVAEDVRFGQTSPSLGGVGAPLRRRARPARAAPPAPAPAVDLGRQGARLRPRRRDEPVRRLRLRPPRQGLPLHPRATTTGGRRSGSCAGPRVVRVLLDDRRAATSASRGATGACGRRLDPAATTRRTAAATAVRLRTRGGKLLADCGAQAARRRRRADPDRRHRRLPRRARGRADRQRRRLAERDQRGQRQPVRQGRDPERVAGLLADGGAAGAGGRGALLRASPAEVDGNGFDLYDDTRSQVYGGLGERDRGAPTGRPSDPGPGRQATGGEIAADLLLGLLGRPHRERRERLLRRRRSPTCRASATPTTTTARCTRWTLRFCGAGDQRPARRLPRRPAEADRGHQARRLAADRLGAARSAPAARRKIRGDCCSARSAPTTAGYFRKSSTASRDPAGRGAGVAGGGDAYRRAPGRPPRVD